MEWRPLYKRDVFGAHFLDDPAANSCWNGLWQEIPARTLKRVEEFIQMAAGWVRVARYE